MTSSSVAEEIEGVSRDLIDKLIAQAVFSVPQKKAVAAAIMRGAGNALAHLSSHEDAEREHMKNAGRHRNMAIQKSGARR